MGRLLAPFFVALLTATSASAKFEITQIEAAHGLLGPVRSSLDVYPLDELLIRFQVVGVQINDEGKTDVESVIRLTNPAGKVVFEQKNTIQRQLSLGGNRFSSFAVLQVPPADRAPPGEYTFSVQLRDRLASESASFERKIQCKAVRFQLLAPRFSRDADGQIPAAMTAIQGENLYFRMRVIGFDTTQKKVRTQLTVQIVDSDGKETLPKPTVTRAELDSPEDVAKATQVTFKGLIICNRPGEFKVRLTVEDVLGKQQETFEAPLKVLAP